MNDNHEEEDHDWGEAERRARMFDHIGEVMEQIRNRKYVAVRLNKLATRLRFVVTTYNEGHDVMKFTLLDPATGSVCVQDNFYFPDPTECILFGCEDDLDGGGEMLQSVVKHNARLVLEVKGKRIEENGPELRVSRLTLHLPGREAFNPWSD
jgi:hypothetical protein